jgi:signal transduction histidine kinase/CheY-like chemotaxis protein
VSAFLISVFFVVIFTLYSIVSCALTPCTSDVGIGMTFLMIAAFVGTAVTLVRTKSAWWAYVFGHAISFWLAVVLPPVVLALYGVGIANADGEPQDYKPTFFIMTPAIIAFLLRSTTPVFVYSAILYAWIVGVTAWNPTNDDLTGVIPSFLMVLLTFSVVTFTLGIFMDVASTLDQVNEVVAARSEVAEAEANAERRANRAKTRFVSVMSHEIRNPLQAILLQLELLEVSNLSKEQYDYVSGITRASHSLLTIVNDILEVTKIEAGAVALESTSVVLRQLVEETVQVHAVAAVSRGVELVCRVEPELRTAVIADPTRIRQVLHNFVSNALKFTNSGEVEVSLDQGSDVDSWTMSVRDTGIGIDDAGREKLFQEFSQVDDSTTRLYGGTGLGLFICKELSELMGGSVSVESEKDVGSTFTSWFRASPDDDEEPLPVHVVSSKQRWIVLLHATNETLRRTLELYISFFLCGMASVRFEHSDKVRTGEKRLTSLLRQHKRSHRIMVVGNYTDCSSSLLSLLTMEQGRRCVPVLLTNTRIAGQGGEREVRAEGWRNVVQKPVCLGQLCSTLEAAMCAADVGDAAEPEPVPADRVPSLPSSSSRKMSDGTMTRGTRLLSCDETAAAAAAAFEGQSTILIVDDFELVRTLVQQLASQWGYHTLVATNGEEAVALLQANYDRISMVLMDCEMPILDGFAATRAIRAFEQKNNVPLSQQVYVCAMTANALQGDERRCFASDMSGVLAKPVRRADLQDIFRRYARVPTERGIVLPKGRSTKKKVARKKV